MNTFYTFSFFFLHALVSDRHSVLADIQGPDFGIGRKKWYQNIFNQSLQTTCPDVCFVSQGSPQLPVQIWHDLFSQNSQIYGKYARLTETGIIL